VSAPVTLRRARAADVPELLALINGYAHRGLLLPRSEPSLRERLEDFTVVEVEGRLAGCGALSALGTGLGEVRSLAVAEDQNGLGLGHLLVDHLLEEAARRGFRQVLALTRRQHFFRRLGFAVTERERYLDKLRADCAACPRNTCCDETAMVRTPPVHVAPAVPFSSSEGEHAR
jgi:N-acetylglutamate synthase-like GNAT family acetyltransferase